MKNRIHKKLANLLNDFDDMMEHNHYDRKSWETLKQTRKIVWKLIKYTRTHKGSNLAKVINSLLTYYPNEESTNNQEFA